MEEYISYEKVDEIWQHMAETSSEEIQTIVDQMEKEQPVLMVYLLSLEEYPFNINEKEIIFYIGTVIWRIMKESKVSLSPVTPEMINQSEDVNYQFLELLSNDTEADFISATQEMIDRYPEPEVLRYLVEALMDDEDDYDDEIDQEGLSEEYEEENNGFESMLETGEVDDIEVEILYEDDEDEDISAMEDEEWEEDDIRPDYRGMAFVHLKSALDALIASRNTA
jgi:hypothetical protein